MLFGIGVVDFGVVLYKGSLEFQQVIHHLRFLLGGEMVVGFLNLFYLLLTVCDEIKVEKRPAEDTVFLQSTQKLLEVDFLVVTADVGEEPLELVLAIVNVLLEQDVFEFIYIY